MIPSKGRLMNSVTSLSRIARPLLVVAALGGAIALAGCAATPSTSPQTQASQAPGQGQQPGGGGVSGLIAAASEGLLQVQSTDEQTAVSYTADTTISSQVAGKLGDVTVGSCVTAITPTDAAAASTVIVTDPVDGECTGGLAGGPGGPGGGFPDGAPTDLPSDFPTDGTLPSGAPTDFPGGAGGFGAFASGPVTAISGDTITVDARSADSTTTSTDVAVGAETVYTVTVDADADALVVGQCVMAQGEADDQGGFAATSLIVSEPGDDGCAPRFGGAQGGPSTDSGGGTTSGTEAG